MKNSINFVFLASIFCLAIKADPKRGETCFNDPAQCDLSKNKDDILNLLEFIYNKGLEKNNNKSIKNGSFIIEDPGYKIFNELQKFAQTAFGSNSCTEVYVTQKSAYPRKSTHLVDLYILRGQAEKNLLGIVSKKGCDYVHYGIDFAKDSLPMAGMQHLLFGKVGKIKNKDLLFIKMEGAGLSGVEALKHTADLIRTSASRIVPSLINSIKAKLGLKKVDLASLEAEFKDLLDSTSFEDSESELIDSRKERIPAQFMAYFLALFLEAHDNKKDQVFQNTKNGAKAYGVQYILESIASLINKPGISADLKEKAQSFIDMLKARYPQDYSSRIGNEIIIKAGERLGR